MRVKIVRIDYMNLTKGDNFCMNIKVTRPIFLKKKKIQGSYSKIQDKKLKFCKYEGSFSKFRALNRKKRNSSQCKCVRRF